MSFEQQQEQDVFFRSPLVPMAKAIPTDKQLINWYNSKLFGVWVDDKRINNVDLKKYSANNFAYHTVSKLMKNAVHYGQYYYHVSLMTNDYYADYYKKRKADKKNMMVVSSSNLLISSNP